MRRHLSFDDDTDTLRLPKHVVWTVVGLSFVPFLLHCAGIDFSSPHLGTAGQASTNSSTGPFTHGLMEWTSVCIAGFTAFLAFLYHRMKPDYLVLTIALVLLFVGPLDAFHTLAASGLVEAKADSRNLIPITWAISRSSKAMLLGLGALILLSKRTLPVGRNTTVLTSIVFASAMSAYLVVHSCAMGESLPNAQFPESVLTRPWDLPALVLFAFSAVFIFPLLFRAQPDLFSHALLLAALPDVATQLHMTFGSSELYDSHFHIAHFQKIVAYLVPLTALSLYFIQAFRRELSATDRLEQAIGGLRKEISVRQQVERQLRSKELRLDQLTGNIREVFWIALPQSIEWIYVSPAYEDIFGRSCESLYQDPWSVLDAIHPDDREEVRSLMEQDIQDDIGLDFRITRPDGQIRWIRTRAFPLQNEEGEVFRVAGISEDVTEQTVAENALRRTEARNRALLDAIPDLIFRVNRDGVYVDYHVTDRTLLKVPPQDFLGKRIWDFFPDLEEAFQKAIEKSLDSGALEVIEYPFELHGEQRDYEARFVKSGEDEIILIVRDITEHKRLEREILEISSREQQRIGHDLHDGLSQQLTGIALLGKALNQKLNSRLIPEAEDARRITDLANAAIAQTRSLARGLSPVELEQQGLSAALEELALGMESLHQVSCRFRCPRDVFVEDHATANHLYRIAQEAVTNALKHARPGRVDIELNKDDGTYTLKVEDDGKGLPDESSRGNGMGFHIMQYRARMIDASLTIEAAPGKGTTVICKLVNKETDQRN